MPEELLSQPDGPVHRLTLNRPARRNALTPELASALAEELERLEERGTAHAVVLAGAGGHFCAGLDLHWLAIARRDPLRAPAAARPCSTSNPPCSPSCAARCPVVAELRGSAAGFGLDLALACDMRVAEAGATFTSAFPGWGWCPTAAPPSPCPASSGWGTRSAS